MVCSACGAKNATDSNYCKQCGQPLEKSGPLKNREAEYTRLLPEEEQVTELLERAYGLRKAADYTAAIALCEEALRLRPESTSAHSLLGQIFEATGERERAIRQYERVLQLNPGSIADRVKLDELRAESLPIPHNPVQPHIVMTRPMAEGSVWRSVSTTIIAAGILVLLGGVLALQLRPRPAETAAHGGAQNTPISKTNVLAAQNTPETGAPANLAGLTSPLGYYPPPIILSSPQSPQPKIVYVPSASETGTRRVSGSLPKTGDTSARSATSSENQARVRLPGEDESVTQDSDGKITIRVGNNSAGSKTRPTALNNAETLPDGGRVKIEIADSNPGGAAEGNNGTGAPATEVGNPASLDALSYIAVGDKLKIEEKYTNAISAYRKALAAAGDQGGLVRQNIAQCFQWKGDKESAITYYQQAITEYEKLVNAGRMVDTARSGIRACERGIKLCSN